MKKYLLGCLLSFTSLFANEASFSAQSDLAADLSDAILNGIYHNRPCCTASECGMNLWLEGFGSYRHRDSNAGRLSYSNGFGGLLGGISHVFSQSSFLNFFLGGSWGNIDIDTESDFSTDSIVFGMSYERVTSNCFFGLVIAGGVLTAERDFSVPAIPAINEDAHGIYFFPEVAFSRPFTCKCFCPIFSANLRYVGYFVGDYQHSETLGRFYVRDRNIQMFTLRGELAHPIAVCRMNVQPYLGIAGRFQFDGNDVDGKLNQDHFSVQDGIDSCIGYGFLGIRGCRNVGCLDLEANFEASYDSDCSYRILGELTLSYTY